MSYETSHTETSDEVAVLFGSEEMLVARRRAIHHELAEVNAGLVAFQQRYTELIAESIAVNGQLSAQGVDTTALAMELAGRLPEDTLATEDVA